MELSGIIFIIVAMSAVIAGLISAARLRTQHQTLVSRTLEAAKRDRRLPMHVVRDLINENPSVPPETILKLAKALVEATQKARPDRARALRRLARPADEADGAAEASRPRTERLA